MTKVEMEALFANQEFVEKIEQAKDNAEIVKLFADNGIEVSEQDIEEVKAMGKNDGELDETALDEVAGGKLIKGPIYWLGYLFGRLVSRGACN